MFSVPFLTIIMRMVIYPHAVHVVNLRYEINLKLEIVAFLRLTVCYFLCELLSSIILSINIFPLYSFDHM